MPHKTREERNAYLRDYYSKNKDKFKRWANNFESRKRKVKGVGWIDREIFLALYKQQEGLCAICHNPLTERGLNTHFDHDHTTGKLRGILCSNCNTGLGKFKDNVDFLLSAISYLHKYKK